VERLQKVLARAGVASRRASEELILAGRVRVNGRIVTELGTTAMPVTLVLDEAGEITTRHLGPLDQDGLNEAIDDALVG